MAAQTVPFARATKLAGIELTIKRVERSAEADGASAARAASAQADAITARKLVPLPPPEPAPDMLYIAVDGTGVPVVAREAKGRRGQGPHRYEGRRTPQVARRSG